MRWRRSCRSEPGIKFYAAGAWLCPEGQPQRVANGKTLELIDVLRLVCDTAALQLQTSELRPAVKMPNPVCACDASFQFEDNFATLIWPR
jgi:hypothetical protein